MKILIADDSATSRALLRSVLTSWGYETVTAKDGLEAVELMTNADPPQLAILDWVMPRMTGPEICKELRARSDRPYVYLIILTSKGSKTETVEGLNAGADDYIVKPFDEHELQMRIRAGVRLLAAISHTRPVLPAIEFYSCFISHSSVDSELAERLDGDLRAEGVTAWYAPKDLRIGDKFRLQIDKSIRMHDKLLLILSESSINSDWVGSEVEAAFDQEQVRRRVDPELRGNTNVLFPIRIDDSVMGIQDGWPAGIRRTRHIGDFRDWKNPDAYREAVKRLIRDLRFSDERDSLAEQKRRQAAERHRY
jgi:DNA-binding response OmpR family regulator